MNTPTNNTWSGAHGYLGDVTCRPADVCLHDSIAALHLLHSLREGVDDTVELEAEPHDTALHHALEVPLDPLLGETWRSDRGRGGGRGRGREREGGKV